MNKEIALIIAHYGSQEVIDRCIQSIEKDLHAELRVIVVNNSAKELTGKDEDKLLVVNANKNQGYAAACNTGILKAQELGINNFILCNNDVVFTKDFFSIFLPRVKELEYPVIVAPKINQVKNPDIVWYSGGRINKFRLEGVHLTNQQKCGFVETEFISGCCFYISQDAFKILGLLDINYFLYDEDLDYSLRAKAKGVKLLVDTNVIIFHDESSTTKDYIRIGKYKSEIYFHKLRSKVLVARKYAEFPYSMFIWVFIFYKYVKYIILFFMRGEFYYVMKLIRSTKDIRLHRM
ncbi:MAG: glycosyltransferase family 2 protein [Melioribacteraceae bacterium]|nr:glycosyltransferase family 2 protein [Melioribacteraceae bacterium]